MPVYKPSVYDYSALKLSAAGGKPNDLSSKRSEAAIFSRVTGFVDTRGEIQARSPILNERGRLMGRSALKASGLVESGRKPKGAKSRRGSVTDEDQMTPVDSPMEEDKMLGSQQKDSSYRRRVERFQMDFDFLESEHVDGEWPQPSSDLLKNIHHFVATSLAASGELRLTANIETADQPKEPVEDQEVTIVDDDVEIIEGIERDMYHQFDSDALLALGMLVQEFIKDQVTSVKPPGFDADVEEWNREHPDEQIVVDSH